MHSKHVRLTIRMKKEREKRALEHPKSRFLARSALKGFELCRRDHNQFIDKGGEQGTKAQAWSAEVESTA